MKGGDVAPVRIIIPHNTTNRSRYFIFVSALQSGMADTSAGKAVAGISVEET